MRDQRTSAARGRGRRGATSVPQPRRSRVVLALGTLALVLIGSVVVGARRGDAEGPARPERRTAASTDGGVGSASAGVSRPATGLDPGLVRAYERARSAAADAGHDLVINSGFRTPTRQQELLDEEIAKRGSFDAASRWVFTPNRSMHVQGLAIDVGDGPGADWLKEHGAAFGLCHTLSWEWWHFEWRQRWQDTGTCPPEAQDPSQAPAR